jgi:DNA-binding response OmpR family regulator
MDVTLLLARRAAPKLAEERSHDCSSSRRRRPARVVDIPEDWIRVPADDIDIRARVATLQTLRAAGAIEPLLDDGVIRLGAAWVSLPPVEARITNALLERFGAVVSRETLARSGWPEGAPGRNALDVHVLRLRRRLAPLGLVIRTVRSRGYLLEASDFGQPTAKEA